MKNFNWSNLSSYSERELKAKLDQLKDETEKCEADYQAWKTNCDNWKKSHANHPNKALFEKYNKEWQQTDRKLQHGQKMAEQKIQKLEDEIFSRESGRPATPPSYVPPPPVPPPSQRPSAWSERQFSTPPPPKVEDPPKQDAPIMPKIDFNMLKSVVEQAKKIEPKKEEPSGPKPNLLETAQSLIKV